MHAPKKLRIRPMANDILRILEESGEDYLPAVINAFARNAPGRENAVAADVGRTLREMLDLGLIGLVFDHGRHGDPTEAEKSLRYDELHRVWLWDAGSEGEPLPRIVLEEKGKQVLNS